MVEFRQSALQRGMAWLALIMSVGFGAAIWDENGGPSLGFVAVCAFAGTYFVWTLWPRCTIAGDEVIVRNIMTRRFSTKSVVSVSHREVFASTAATIELEGGGSHPVWAIQRDGLRGFISSDAWVAKQSELADALAVPVRRTVR